MKNGNTNTAVMDMGTGKENRGANFAAGIVNRAKAMLLLKKEGDQQIVITLVLIVIALVLAFLFKNQITTFMTNAITTLSTKMDTLLQGLS